MKLKSKILSIIIIVLLASCGQNENPEKNSKIEIVSLMNKASELYLKKDFKNAVLILEDLLKLPYKDKFKKELGSIYYDLACNYALLGNKRKALDNIAGAAAHGYANAEHMMNDGDLESIRNETEFLNILRKLERKQKLWNNRFINTGYSENISETEKIAGLSRLWSEIKFNFINFDLVPNVNLDSLYMKYLPLVKETSSTFEYYKVLQNFCVQLKDGHTKVIFPKEVKDRLSGRVPIQTRLVENRIIITKVYDSGDLIKELKAGMEIIKINQINAMEYARKFIMPYYITNSKQGRERTIFEYALLRGPVGESVNITYKNQAGKISSIDLPRLKRITTNWKPVEFTRLGGNIGYLNIKSFYSSKIVAEVDSLFPDIMKTSGLIIDIRENGGGNGRVGWPILSYFTDKPFSIFKWKSRLYNPIWRAWGRSESEYSGEPSIIIADEEKYYDRPVELLVRERTASMAENFCAGFKIINRGRIIGSPTMGSSGTPLFFSLPGGGSAQVVTTRSSFPDGTEFVGCGVDVDIEVHPTIDDFSQNRDRVLETAISVLEKDLAAEKNNKD